jgi:hypothetical protein
VVSGLTTLLTACSWPLRPDASDEAWCVVSPSKSQSSRPDALAPFESSSLESRRSTRLRCQGCFRRLILSSSLFGNPNMFTLVKSDYRSFYLRMVCATASWLGTRISAVGIGNCSQCRPGRSARPSLTGTDPIVRHRPDKALVPARLAVLTFAPSYCLERSHGCQEF